MFNQRLHRESLWWAALLLCRVCVCVCARARIFKKCAYSCAQHSFSVHLTLSEQVSLSNFHYLDHRRIHLYGICCLKDILTIYFFRLKSFFCLKNRIREYIQWLLKIEDYMTDDQGLVIITDIFWRSRSCIATREGALVGLSKSLFVTWTTHVCHENTRRESLFK
jgi:hypothetical protein